MRPMEGLKVLDFCWVAVGPMTTSYLAEYGATVVRVESKLRPEVLRSAPPFGGDVRGPNRSAYYANYNANKFGFGLNMAHPQGVEIVKRFVAWADLVTENFTPGTLEKWGLGTTTCALSSPTSSCSAPPCWAAAVRIRGSRVSARCCRRSAV